MVGKRSAHQPDYILIISFVFLIALGLIFLTSASYSKACQDFDDCYFFLKNQLLRGVLPGAFLFLFFYFLDCRILKKKAFWALILALALLIIVFIPGLGFAKGGTRSWVKIGIVFQPSEIAKLLFVVYLAAWLSNQQNIKSWRNVFMPFVVSLAAVSVLIIAQPDLGTLSIICFTSLIIYFAAGGSLKQIALLITLGGAVFSAVIITSSYRLARLLTFLKPDNDPTGIGYHITQAILAVSSGGLWGKVIGFSTHKIRSLPEVTSDSIFAVIAEEGGFLLTTLMVGFFLFLAYRIFKLAKSSQDNFSRLLCIGIGSWFIIQTILNMGAMLGLLPLTGIPLPLVGYGGTSFCAFAAAFGILANISKYTIVNSKQ